MKLTLKILVPLLISSSFLLTSCSKEGEIGPMGPRGEQGLQGAQGPQGSAGQDGEVVASAGTDESQAGGVVEGEQGQQGDSGPKGEQGETGEQGQQGETGPKGNQGEAGEDGQDGAEGEDGNANVMDSGWMPFTPPAIRIEDPVLTFDLINDSVILVFGRWSDGEVVIFQFPHQIAQEKYSYQLSAEAPTLPFDITFSVEVPKGIEAFRCDAVKYIIIPNSSVTAKNMTKNFGKMAYKEIVEQFGLKY